MTLVNPAASPAALCQAPGLDPDWWSSDDSVDVARAVAVCHRSGEEQACLIWALRTRQRGPVVFGGHWFRPPPARRVS